jgi:hypothetical protein
MTNRKYNSTDASAPALTNTIGDFTTLLDRVIVTGYPTQSITGITRSASVATVNKTGHGYSVGMVISHSGANEDGYNGNKTVASVIDANNYTFAVDPATATPATGTLLASTATGKAGLGWQLVFTGTNKRVYRPRSGSRMYFRVAHDRVAYMAEVAGFETMSDVDTGTGRYPTTTQISATNAGNLRWQLTGNVAGTKVWQVWGNDTQILWMGEEAGSRAAGYFGDIVSFKSGDAYNSLIIGKPADQTSFGNGEPNWMQLQAFAASGSAIPSQQANGLAGHYMPRAASQVGSAIAVNKYTDGTRHQNSTMGAGTAGTDTMAYPDSIMGGLQLARLFVGQTGASGGPRGYIPGIWNVCHNQASMTGVAHKDTFTASDGVNSFSGEIQFQYSNGANCFALEL